MKKQSHIEIAHCVLCRSAFKRGIAEKWKRLCVSCWAFDKAAQAHDQQQRWLKLVR